MASVQWPMTDLSTILSTPACTINVLKVRRSTWAVTFTSMLAAEAASARGLCKLELVPVGSRRGPHHRGQWEGEGVRLEHFLLPIRAPETRQPCISPCRRYVFVLNGELYNYGNRHSTNDTILLGQTLSEGSIGASLRRLDGEYAVAVFDRIENRLVLARDPMGIKPLFYSTESKRVVFGSHAGDVARIVGAGPCLFGISEYLQHLPVSAQRTTFNGVNSVPTSSFLEITRGTNNCLVINEQERGRATSRSMVEGCLTPESIRATLDTCIHDMVPHDHTPYILLSGGLDSSILAYHLSAQAQLDSRHRSPRTVTYDASCPSGEHAQAEKS